jgi:hypothetical protein
MKSRQVAQAVAYFRLKLVDLIVVQLFACPLAYFDHIPPHRSLGNAVNTSEAIVWSKRLSSSDKLPNHKLAQIDVKALGRVSLTFLIKITRMQRFSDRLVRSNGRVRDRRTPAAGV